MNAPLSTVRGIGKVAIAIFEGANLQTVGDLYRSDANDRAIKLSIDNLRYTFRGRTEAATIAYWKSHFTRCVHIILRVRNGRRKQENPDYLLCPITGELMRDPVITTWGVTYERENIEEYFNDNSGTILLPPECPTHEDFAKRTLIRNNALASAIEYYNDNYRGIVI